MRILTEILDIVVCIRIDSMWVERNMVGNNIEYKTSDGPNVEKTAQHICIWQNYSIILSNRVTSIQELSFSRG